MKYLSEDQIFKPTALSETADLMSSTNPYERLRGEYYQVIIRSQLLENMLIKYKMGALDFKPITPYRLLKKQLKIMKKYASILEDRLFLESEVFVSENAVNSTKSN